MSRGAAFTAILLGATLCFAVALDRALSVPLSADIAWQLHIAELLARGGQLGRDVIEVNPPLSAWLEVPVVRLAGAIGVRAALGHEAAVLLLGTLSVMLLALAGEHVSALRTAGRLVVFSLTVALALAFQAGLEVGQREQLAIMLTLPYFVLLAVRLEGADVHPWLARTIGVAAGFGFALKPFFVLPLLLGELLLTRRRGLRCTVRRPEPMAVAVVFVSYVVAIAVVAPGWLADARTFWPLYGGYRPATLYDVATRQGVVIALALVALIAWTVARRRLGRGELANALAVALAGFLVAMLVQRKPWIYLAIPSGVLALAVLLALAFETSGQLSSRAGRLLRAVLVLLTALRALRYVWWMVHSPVVSLTDRAALVDYTRLRTILDSLPVGTTYASLSPTHGVTFPLVQDVGGEWAMRLPSLWPVMSDAAQDPATQARLRRLVVADLQRRSPQIILVLMPGSTYAWLGAPARRDWIGWLGESAEGRQALAPYARWRDLGEYVLLRR